MTPPSCQLWKVMSVTLGLAGIWGLAIEHNVVREGRRAYDQSELAFNSGELKAAVDWACRSGAVNLTGDRWLRASIERLRAIGIGSEATSRQVTAQLAWTGLASVIAATGNSGAFTALSQESVQHLDVLQSRNRGASTSPTQKLVGAPVSVGDARGPWMVVGLAAGGLALALFFGFAGAHQNRAHPWWRHAKWLLVAGSICAGLAWVLS